MNIIIHDLEQITPDWLTHILQQNGALHGGRVLDVRGLKSTTTDISSVYHLSIMYSTMESPHSAPARLFLKIPNPDTTWADREYTFYTRIEPAMRQRCGPVDGGWPFLRCYDARYNPRTGASHLLLEDVSETYSTRDDLQPPAQEHLHGLIDGLALLHAAWWQHPHLGTELGSRLTEDTLSGLMTEAQENYYHFMDFMGEGLSERQRDILERVVEGWPPLRLQRLLAGQGLTLVHRDLHPLNIMYSRNVLEPSVKLVDWQSWRVDTGTDDLAYMLACHWTPEQRSREERSLVARYYRSLVAQGVTGYNWEQCWYDYRASIHRCLFFLMMAWSPERWGAGGWWERVENALLAFDDLDCMELLET